MEALLAREQNRKKDFFYDISLRIASLQLSGSARGLLGSNPSLLKKKNRAVVLRGCRREELGNIDKDLPTNEWYRSLIIPIDRYPFNKFLAQVRAVRCRGPDKRI